MLNLKKYANGRYYDMDRKAFVLKSEVAERVRRGRKLQVTAARDGADITARVVAELGGRPPAEPRGDAPARGLGTWMREGRARLNEQIDGRIDRVLETLNLPTRDQVVQLTAGITALTEKIRELETLQARQAAEAAAEAAEASAEEARLAEVTEAKETPAAPAAEAAAG